MNPESGETPVGVPFADYHRRKSFPFSKNRNQWGE